MRYEVYKKQDLGTRNGLPISTHYTLDAAMEACKKHSRGTTTEQVWDPKVKADPSDPFGGGMVDVELPNRCVIVERGNKQSRIRMWGVDGKLHDARDCSRCKNTGQDANFWKLLCKSCNGASYRPKV